MSFPYRLPIVGTISANAQTVFADISGSPQSVLVVTGTFAGHNVTFELSYDSTNGTNGNWVQISAVRSNRSLAETASGALSAAPAYSWIIPTIGAQFIRVRATAHTSGTATWRIQPCAEQQNFHTSSTMGAASGAALTGGTTRVGARARTSLLTVSNDQLVDAVATLNGAITVRQNAIPEACWSHQGSLTTTADVAAKAAAGANVRNYVTGFIYQNTSAVNTGVVIKDGATTIAVFQATASMALPAVIVFPTPLRGSSNAVINIAALVTGANVLINTNGFTGA